MSSHVTMGPVFLRGTGVMVFITVMTKVMKKDVHIMKVQVHIHVYTCTYILCVLHK